MQTFACFMINQLLVIHFCNLPVQYKSTWMSEEIIELTLINIKGFKLGFSWSHFVNF
jgi:hypothetical protein